MALFEIQYMYATCVKNVVVQESQSEICEIYEFTAINKRLCGIRGGNKNQKSGSALGSAEKNCQYALQPGIIRNC